MDVWEKAEQNTNKVERKLVVGTMESSLFNRKGKTCMGCPGKLTALYCNHILIHNMLTRKICRPFFSFQTRFLFPLLLSPLSPTSPLILSACYNCQQVSMCQRRFSATNCFPFLNYCCLSVMSTVSLSMSICFEKEFSVILPPPFIQLWPASPPAIIWKHSSKVTLTNQKPPFLSPRAAMYLSAAILLLLLLHSAESGRGAPHYGARGRAWRGGRLRRQAQECKEYIEAGEKYLDCQDQQLTTVMQDWPTDIQHLLLARNKIQVWFASVNVWKFRHVRVGDKTGFKYENVYIICK